MKIKFTVIFILFLLSACATADKLTRTANKLYQEGKIKKAINIYNRAIQIDPRYLPAWNNRATAFFKIGEDDRALSDLGNAEKLNRQYSVKTQSPDVYINRSAIYLKYRLYDNALANIEKALRAGLSNKVVLNNHGMAMVGKGRWKSALRDYNKTLKLDPQYAPAYNNRGVLFFYANNFKQAIKDFTRALNIEPNNAAFYYNRGLAYYANGEAFKALADLQKSEKLGYKPAAKILQKL